MNSRLKRIYISVAAISLALTSLINPAARAYVSSDFGISPNDLVAGQAAIFTLEIENCEIAPTNIEVQIVNENVEMTIDMTYANFTSEIVEGTYLAAWNYTGVNNAGLKKGEIDVEVNGSGGCVDENGEYLGDDGEDVNKYGSTITENTYVGMYPDLNGLKINWSKVIGAKKYEVWFKRDDWYSNVVYEWVKAGETKKTTFTIPDSAGVEYSKYYQVKISPIMIKGIGVNSFSYSQAPTSSHVEFWTSLAGSLEPVSKFNEDQDVQFNLRIENCNDISGLYDGSRVHASVWPGSLDGSREYTNVSDVDWEINSTEFFKNLEGQWTDETLTLRWELQQDVPAGTYMAGNYLMSGCALDNWTDENQYPFSEYVQFSVTENGKTPPAATSINATFKATPTSISYEWGSPRNSGDGPFTYRVYNTNYSEDKSDWTLLTTTKKHKFTMENLLPDTSPDLVVEVSNSAGVGSFWLDGRTANPQVKFGASLTKKQIAKAIAIPKSAQAKFTYTLESFETARNVCSVKKGKLVFAKKLGICNFRGVWKVAGIEYGEDFMFMTIK